jgi:uncharacterized protein DUF4440
MLVNAVVCAAALFFGGWQSTASREAEVLAREQQRVSFLVARDYDRLAELLSPTLTYTHSSADIDSRDTLLGDLRSGKLVYRALKHRDVQVRFVTPDVAILNGLSDIESTVGGEPRTTPLRFTMVYVKKNGVWLMEAWHATRRPA